MRLPPDWEARSSGGYFPHLAYLKHTPCGFETGFPYDLNGMSEPFGERSARELVYTHQCEPDD